MSDAYRQTFEDAAIELSTHSTVWTIVSNPPLPQPRPVRPQDEAKMRLRLARRRARRFKH